MRCGRVDAVVVRSLGWKSEKGGRWSRGNAIRQGGLAHAGLCRALGVPLFALTCLTLRTTQSVDCPSNLSSEQNTSNWMSGTTCYLQLICLT
jgi:hypothetical protein